MPPSHGTLSLYRAPCPSVKVFILLYSSVFNVVFLFDRSSIEFLTLLFVFTIRFTNKSEQTGMAEGLFGYEIRSCYSPPPLSSSIAICNIQMRYCGGNNFELKKTVEIEKIFSISACFLEKYG